MNLSPQRLFPEIPKIAFHPQQTSCQCGKTLRVQKTRKSRIATLPIGEIECNHTYRYCVSCKKTYDSEQLRELVPYQCRFGFDVLVYVGKALFVECWNEQKIQAELKEKNISISIREIGYLGTKFITYLSIVHQQSTPQIKGALDAQGGYILHLDGTCESDSPHLVSGIDEMAKIVLGNVKLPSENQKQITAFLQELKANYGQPLALVHDMGTAILGAVEQVFPGVPDFICHFHFLRDIGKDLFEIEHGGIRSALKKYRIRTKIGQLERKLRQRIEQNKSLKKTFHCYETTRKKLDPTVSAYLLILWIKDSKKELKGYGFPFDQKHLSYYERLKEAMETIDKMHHSSKKNSPVSQLRSIISPVINDQNLKRNVMKMREKVHVFNRLRDALQIALPNDNEGLNDDGEKVNMQSIQEKVMAFRQDEKICEAASKDITYKKMLKQIDKYWEKLFADPIEVQTSQGSITIQPQRTNNLLERFFREIKRKARKKGGSRHLSKFIKSMIANTPLIKNLENPQYLKLILNGVHSLEQRFAQVDAKLVQDKMKENQCNWERIPTSVQKGLRKKGFLETLAQMTRVRGAS